MNIYDYIPDYPDLENPKFNQLIQYKKEFYDLKTGNEKLPFGKPGSLWPHQKLLSRFVSPYTNYDEQLLFHSPGTGKTCGAIAIVEVNKQDPLVRKPVLIIVPNDTLVNQWKSQIAFTCTEGQYVPENYFSTDDKQLTVGEKTARVNKLLGPVYHITTIEKMRRQIDKIQDDIVLKKRFSNTIIIIDEAHNLRIETHASKEEVESSKNRYAAFHRFLHVIENSKKILLTGTPMYDRISELPGLLNLILPLNKQLPVGAAFTKLYLTKEDNIRKIKNEKTLMNYLLGKVSYIREGGNFPQRVDIGEFIWTKFIKTVPTNLSDLQLQGYLEAYKKDTTSKTFSSRLWPNSRQAAVFIYKHNNEYLWHTNVTNLIVTKSKPKKIKIDGRDMTYIKSSIKQEYANDIKTNLELYSAKYAYIVDFLNKNPTNPTYIFTPLVSGGGGAIFLGLILELFGYSKAMGNIKTPGKRYALIIGEDKSSSQRKKIIDIFNSPENRNGEIIQVLIASKTISEGTSFTNVKHEIVISPYWNNSGTEQAIGRGLRADSLSYLPNEDRIVTVQQLAINSPKLTLKENVDAGLYRMSEAKDFEIKDAERLLKKVAWDCALNYDRNVRTIDKDYSRNCDYQKCNYVCYQTTPQKIAPKWTYMVPDDKLDKSTYLIYYSKPELLDLVNKMTKLLQQHSIININGINNLLDIDDFKLLILTIEYMIENHITVYNKWGQKCFLRRQGNTLFLSDIPTESNVLGSWYTKFPFANGQTPLDKIINDDIYTKDLIKLSKLNLQDKKKAEEIIKELNIETKIFMLEYLLKLQLTTKMTPQQKKMYDIFLDLFKGHIFKNDGIIIHDLKKIRLSKEYVDFTVGESGNIRCLKDGIWSDCTKKDEDAVSKMIKEYKEDKKKDFASNDYGIYAIKSTDGKFKIVDKTKQKTADTTDARIKIKGKVCTAGWKKWELIDIYIRLDIDIPKRNKQMELSNNKDDLLEKIKQQKLEQCFTDKKNMTINNMKKALILNDFQTKILCEHMEQWFGKNDLIIYET
jgi:superfamily II DNA or RNA helicase